MMAKREGRGGTRNKLRTYSMFKRNFRTETYVQNIMNIGNRSALAKFRCGVAPIVMFLFRCTCHRNVVGNTDHSRTTLKDLIHVVLEDILTHNEHERHTKVGIPTKGFVKSC